MNHPFYEVVADADEQIAKGATVFQKFTCSKCGNRLTMDVPNRFFTSGDCDKCGGVTDIVRDGCNFMLIAPLNEAAVDKIDKAVLAIRSDVVRE